MSNFVYFSCATQGALSMYFDCSALYGPYLPHIGFGGGISSVGKKIFLKKIFSGEDFFGLIFRVGEFSGVWGIDMFLVEFDEI